MAKVKKKKSAAGRRPKAKLVPPWAGGPDKVIWIRIDEDNNSRHKNWVFALIGVTKVFFNLTDSADAGRGWAKLLADALCDKRQVDFDYDLDPATYYEYRINDNYLVGPPPGMGMPDPRTLVPNASSGVHYRLTSVAYHAKHGKKAKKKGR